MPSIPIAVYLNDLPSTNASDTVTNVQSVIKDKDVLFFAKPGSFYDQLFLPK